MPHTIPRDCAFQFRCIIRVHRPYFIFDCEEMQEVFVHLITVLVASRVHETKVRIHVLHNQSNLLTLDSEVPEILCDHMIKSDMVSEFLGFDRRGTPPLPGMRGQHFSLLTYLTVGVLGSMSEFMFRAFGLQLKLG